MLERSATQKDKRHTFITPQVRKRIVFCMQCFTESLKGGDIGRSFHAEQQPDPVVWCDAQRIGNDAENICAGLDDRLSGTSITGNKANAVTRELCSKTRTVRGEDNLTAGLQRQ